MAHDAAGNANTSSTSTDNTVTYNPDTTPPTVTINQAAGQADPASASPISFTVVFSKPVADFGTGDVTLSGTAGATTAIVTGSGTTYNVLVSGMTGSGTVIASIAAGVAHDTAGNANASSTSTDNMVTYSPDTTPPTVTINQAAGQADPTSNAPINFTAVFSEPVTDFGTGDVTLSGTAGATTAIVTGSGTNYNVAVSGMTASGTVIASIAAGRAHDAAGNPSAASTSTDNSVTYQYIQPPSTAGTIGNTNEGTSTDDLWYNGAWINACRFQAPSNMTVVTMYAKVLGITGKYKCAIYAESSSVPSQFLRATAEVSNPTTGWQTFPLTAPQALTNGNYYWLAIWADSPGAQAYYSDTSGTIRWAQYDYGNWPDPINTTDGGTLTYCIYARGAADTTPPTVTINQTAGQADPASASPINFTVVFSEPVTDFATGDVTLGGTAGATTATVTGSGTTYNVAVSGMTGSGTVIASIAAGVAHDAAGNANPSSTSTDNTVTYSPDTTPPTVTINQAAGQADPASASPINFTVVFSEPVTDFSSGDVTLSGTAGATTRTVTGTGTTYNVAVSGMTGSGTVIASIAAGVAHDAAGNANTSSTSTDNTVTYNPVTTPPTVTINQAAGQPDPTNAAPINFSVVFSKPVTDFATGDVTLSGTAGATTAIVTGSSTNYNVAVSGMTGSGTVIASIAAGVAHDASGNGNTASTSTDNTVTYDVTPLTVTINQAAGQPDPTNAAPINFTAVFSKAVTDFVTGDVTLGGTAGATTAIVSGSGTTYNVAVSGMTGSGTVIATVAAGVAHDAAGNANTSSTSTDNTVTYQYASPFITYVGNVGTVVSNAAGTTLQLPVGSAGVAAGNTLVVGIASRGSTTYNTPTVTDSAGNTYNLATNAITYGHGRAYLFYAYAGTALTNGSIITITTSSVSNRVAVASVFSGLSGAGVLDQALGNPTGTTNTLQGNSPTVGPTATTAQANELIIGVIGTEEATDAGVGTWLNGFTAGPQIKSSVPPPMNGGSRWATRLLRPPASLRPPRPWQTTPTGPPPSPPSRPGHPRQPCLRII